MQYCDECRIKNSWPDTRATESGVCGFCGADAALYSSSATSPSAMPARDPQTASRLGREPMGVCHVGDPHPIPLEAGMMILKAGLDKVRDALRADAQEARRKLLAIPHVARLSIRGTVVSANRPGQDLVRRSDVLAALSNPEHIRAVTSLPSRAWWHPDGHVVFNQKGAELLLRDSVLAVVAWRHLTM